MFTDPDPQDHIRDSMKLWNEFGSITCQNSKRQHPLKFVDLRPLTAPVLPVVLPASLHFYWADDGVGICATAFTCKTTPCRGYAGLESLIQSRVGIPYLLYVVDISDQLTGPDCWHARIGWICATLKEPYERALFKPRSVTDLLTQSHPPLVSPGPVGVDKSLYPHRCPKCSGPAYVGLSRVDCPGGCR